MKSKNYFLSKGHSNPNLNVFMAKHGKELERLLEKGVYSAKSQQVNVKLIGSIQDSPALAKVCNSTQFNGRFGCIHCMSPGTQLQQPKKRIYEYSKTIEIRTNADYKVQVATSLSTASSNSGIKGPCWIAKYISIPEDIILDYMHLTCIGTLQKLLSLWLTQYKDLAKNKNVWYLCE